MPMLQMSTYQCFIPRPTHQLPQERWYEMTMREQVRQQYLQEADGIDRAKHGTLWDIFGRGIGIPIPACLTERDPK